MKVMSAMATTPPSELLTMGYSGSTFLTSVDWVLASEIASQGPDVSNEPAVYNAMVPSPEVSSSAPNSRMNISWKFRSYYTWLYR